MDKVQKLINPESFELFQQFCFRIQGLIHLYKACSPLPNKMKSQMTKARTLPKPYTNYLHYTIQTLAEDNIQTFYFSHMMKRKAFTISISLDSTRQKHI
jgi:hypothetical protein